MWGGAHEREWGCWSSYSSRWRGLGVGFEAAFSEVADAPVGSGADCYDGDNGEKRGAGLGRALVEVEKVDWFATFRAEEVSLVFNHDVLATVRDEAAGIIATLGQGLHGMG